MIASEECSDDPWQLWNNRLSKKMERQGVKPNNATVINMLSACASCASLEHGKRVHVYIKEAGIVPNISIWNSLLDMYAKCGSLEDACKIFNNMRQRDVISWNAIIGGYSKGGDGAMALSFFKRMQLEGVKPDLRTFISVFNACASLAALEQGKHVHARMIESGIVPDVFACNCLVDMYGKCGSIEGAGQVFDNMQMRNLVTWNAMIGAYARCGQGREALGLLKKMHGQGVKADHITFVCVLSACSHAGLVDEGLQCFKSMTQVHGISPTVEHYACMVDLLGRAGQLEVAESIVRKMPFRANAVVLLSLLGACRTHGNLVLAEQVAGQLLELEPENSAGYILLSNMYAAAGSWDSRRKVRELMKCRSVKKQFGA